MNFDTAVKEGAMALFGEKYSDTVRVLDIGSSRELCGGTHVQRVGDIGLFKLTSESGVAAGVRRIEAITGKKALAYVQTLHSQMQLITDTLKTNADDIVQRIELLQEQTRSLEKTNDNLKSKLVSYQLDQLCANARNIADIKVIATELSGSDTKSLRIAVDQLKHKLHSAVIVLACVQQDKASLVIGVTANLTTTMPAGELANFVAQQIGGKGGGKPDMAQAGGAQLNHLPQALTSVFEWVQTKSK
jgi:alanyl-tRNA synthetase